MAPASVVVTGANRGIGFGLVQQFLKNSHIKNVIATARNVEKAKALHAIKDPRLHILPLSVTCDESIDNFVSKVSEIVGDNGLNLLVNNAGILLECSSKSEPNQKILTEQLDTNTVSIVVLSQKLLPLLLKASRNRMNSANNFSISRAAVITISAGYGSMSTNDRGSAFFQSLADRMSKAAVNQFTRTFAIDLKDDHILAASFCPGWVKTDLGTAEGTLTVEESTSTLVDSFGKLKESHNGGFFRRDLTIIPF